MKSNCYISIYNKVYSTQRFLTFSATLHITDCIFTHHKLRTNNLIK